MSDSPTSTDSDLPRPLPRRAISRPTLPRANRPRFQAPDFLWAAVLAALSLAVSARAVGLTGQTLGPILAAAGTVAALYLLGWRARDRAAGIAAGLLAATSLPFLQTAASAPQSALFLFLTVAALFAFVTDSSLAALALAAAAAFVRPEGLLLGLLLAGLALAQHRRRAIYGTALFFVTVLGVWSAQVALYHVRPAFPALNFHPEALTALGRPASLLLLWFLLPLAAEFSEPMRRARWLPVALWALLTLATGLGYAPTRPDAMALPLTAVLFALAGGGVSRLLPTLTGEFPGPAPRYLLATLAVLALTGLHLRLEEPNVFSALLTARH